MDRELDKRFDYIINHVDTKSLLLEAQPADTSLDRLKEYLDRIYDFYEASTKRCRFISGGISGAISDPLSNKALRHAEVYYEEIRHRTDDIKKIWLQPGFLIATINNNRLIVRRKNLTNEVVEKGVVLTKSII